MVIIYWTDEAIDWLQDIYVYLSKNNPRAARNTINKILEKTKILQDFPEIAAVYPIDLPYPIRVIYYTHYRIAYKIVDEKRIDILGVFHGGMEIKRYLI